MWVDDAIDSIAPQCLPGEQFVSCVFEPGRSLLAQKHTFFERETFFGKNTVQREAFFTALNETTQRLNIRAGAINSLFANSTVRKSCTENCRHSPGKVRTH